MDRTAQHKAHNGFTEIVNQQYQEGVKEFFYEDYEKAIECFTKAISEDNNNAEYYIKRGFSFKRLGMVLDAISDLKIGLTLVENNKELDNIRRVSSVISELLIESKQLEEAIEYYKKSKALLVGSNNRSKDSASYAKKMQNIEALESKLKSAGAKLSDVKNEAALHRPKYEYYQSDDFVIIDIFHKNLNKDSVRTLFELNAVSVFIKNADESIVEIRFTPLFDNIVAEKSSFKILSTKLEIKLAKQECQRFWVSLEKSAKTEEAQNNTKLVNDYPSSNVNSSTRSKNWSAIENEIDRELAVNEENSDLSSLFSKIYRDADDDTRRAMMKSYIESNGTTLSTNWKDVAKGTVETKPPQGMIPKSYK
ncbi:hypothetical protein BB561_000402 [Smittium simulii]|uniref:SGS domain-containing protein n=1 Tax=Smittium simulii TaxID=133385 RepID=A0A2T9YZE7_9FUNG|nr:hypothetical protein BB561_000402 [Smittium simulii]